MSTQLDATAYLDHLRATDQLSNEAWPERLVVGIGLGPRRRRRGDRATPFGSLRRSGNVGMLQVELVGGPAMAVVVESLQTLGISKLIVVGRCGGVDPALEPASLVVAHSVDSGDGTSAAYGASGVTELSPVLTSSLATRGGSPPLVRARSIDAPFRIDASVWSEMRRRRIGVVEMELAAARAAAPLLDLGAVFVVSDQRFEDRWEPADPKAVTQALSRAAALAEEVLDA